MADKTKIEWTEATWNPLRAVNKHNPARDGAAAVGWFCIHVSPGCANCYAEQINKRLGNGKNYVKQEQPDLDFFLHERTLTQPLRWRKPRMIFVCSMTDLFGEWVPDEWIDKVFAVMALAPQHTFQVLTKRSARLLEYFQGIQDGDGFRVRSPYIFDAVDVLCSQYRLGARPAIIDWPLPNVWLGVSVEDQARADERIPDLLATPAAVRWISAEPLLAAVNLWSDANYPLPGGGTGSAFNWGKGITWIVAGGESGPGARPMHPDWARSLRDQCAAVGVPFFMKQMTKKGPIPDDLMVREWPRCTAFEEDA
jgi:protein gp37